MKTDKAILQKNVMFSRFSDYSTVSWTLKRVKLNWKPTAKYDVESTLGLRAYKFFFDICSYFPYRELAVCKRGLLDAHVDVWKKILVIFNPSE